MVAGGAAAQVTLAGVTLPPSIEADGRQLQLGGCAVREMWWMNLYTLGLYLPDPPADVPTVLQPGTPKLVRMDVVYDGKVPSGLPEDWRERLRQEVSGEFLRTLQGLYDDLKGGDTVTFVYTPGRGMTLAVNGEQVAAKSGHETMEAMLRLFVGPDPVSENMKRLLLQGSCPPTP
jgi:hypothetical protein